LKAEMKRFTSVDTSVLKQHYDKKVQDLEQEKRLLQVSAYMFTCYVLSVSGSCLYTYLHLCCQCTERD
jgi:kinesin family protein 4/21/27